MSRRFLSFFLLAAAATFAAPGLVHGQEGSDDSVEVETVVPVDVNQRTTVVVENDNFLDVRVYAVSAGRRKQLGTVTGFTSAVFVLPKWVLATNTSVRLVALPVGTGRTYASPPVLVDPGDLVEWQLRGNLSLSSISVWKS